MHTHIDNNQITHNERTQSQTLPKHFMFVTLTHTQWLLSLLLLISNRRSKNLVESGGLLGNRKEKMFTYLCKSKWKGLRKSRVKCVGRQIGGRVIFHRTQPTLWSKRYSKVSYGSFVKIHTRNRTNWGAVNMKNVVRVRLSKDHIICWKASQVALSTCLFLVQHHHESRV